MKFSLVLITLVGLVVVAHSQGNKGGQGGKGGQKGTNYQRRIFSQAKTGLLEKDPAELESELRENLGLDESKYSDDDLEVVIAEIKNIVEGSEDFLARDEVRDQLITNLAGKIDITVSNEDYDDIITGVEEEAAAIAEWQKQLEQA